MSAVGMAFQALRASKLRAALTILGTVIGVTCVVALWHIGSSGRRYMSDSLSSIAQDMIFVHSRYNASEEDQRRHRHRPLTLRDVAAIPQSCPSAKDVSPVLFGMANAVYGTRFRSTQLRGCYPSYLTICQYKLEDGVAFSDADLRGGNRVVLLGSTVAKELFGALDPVGEKLRLNQVPFTVIGVLKEKGSFFGDNQDDRVLIPYTSMADHLGGDRSVHQILVSAHSRDLIPQLKNEVRLALRAARKIPADRHDGLEIFDLGEVAKSVDGVLIGITMLLGAIGAVSLLVGGIGIMNIMLVSVTERTKEIGLRIALGATDFNVLTQFLVEAMVLSGLGGVAGAASGLGLAWVGTEVLTVATKRPWQTDVSLLCLAAAVAFALAIGVFFGFYPAWRASRLDPIAALRHE